jgi:polyhydroxyalkanoate synthesis regulator phasin
MEELMNSKTESTKQPKDAEEHKYMPFYELSRRMLLASVGVISLAQDELQAFVDTMVERGELVEKDARKMMEEVKEFRTKLEKEREAKRKATAAASAPANVATKSDIEALEARIAELTKKLDELKKQP